MTTPEEEKRILTFWKEHEIYKKSIRQNARGKKFYFMDGPPYATGYIHLGTALNKTLKDIAMRSQRLQGKNVFDRPGYDTHGLPIEFQIEKEIGSKSKEDIEKYGVKKFISKKADEKKLLYLGKYPVHVCPRCETAVAYNEIEYKAQEDNSVYVKFPL